MRPRTLTLSHSSNSRPLTISFAVSFGFQLSQRCDLQIAIELLRLRKPFAASGGGRIRVDLVRRLDRGPLPGFEVQFAMQLAMQRPPFVAVRHRLHLCE